jgi:hypothetical protein
MSKPLQRFWAWYERYYALNVTLTAALFLLQVVHLYWLTAHVVMERLTGVSYFNPLPLWQYIIIVVDYTEIPALISTSILYIYELRKDFRWRYIVFLIFLNSQWLHLFWITDEFVVNEFGSESTVLPTWLAWVAICIDYLEIPVMIATIWRVGLILRKSGLQGIVKSF